MLSTVALGMRLLMLRHLRGFRSCSSHPHHGYGDAGLRLEVPALPFAQRGVGGRPALHVLTHDALSGDDIGEIGLVVAERLAVSIQGEALVHAQLADEA